MLKIYSFSKVNAGARGHTRDGPSSIRVEFDFELTMS
jgi:hypothetical protein